ncbi:uncharacterized protein [Mytilus edulis]|uniref:uncharacterized protein n=1 Tax=Mytilus edulis TaxID=6550 RepID=UPI0039EE6793
MTSKLKSIRAGHRSAVSRILRRFEERSETEEKPEEDELETILDTLKEKQDILKDLDKNILDSVQEEDIEQEILDTDEYKFNLETKIRKIRKFIQAQTSNLNAAARSFSPHNETLQPIHNVGPVYNIRDDSQNTGLNFTSLRSNSSVNSSNFHKLPKLNLPTFDGNVLEWQSFWDSFDSAIHNNNTLTDVQRFNYLKSLLEGEASYTIAGFALTHTNYNKAIELIHERFGQKHKIIQSYMQALLDIPAPKNTLSQLRSYYDRTETYIRGLESLGQAQDSYGSLLIPVILNKMPGEIRKNLTREHGSSDWFLGDLRRSIFKELAILESGSSTESFESPSTTATFYTNTKSRENWPKTNSPQKSYQISCAYCKEPHFSSECTKYIDQNDRMKIVKEDRLCFNCLGRHRVVDCKSKSNCKKCDRRHHTSLCNNDHDKETTSTSSTSTVQKHNAEESDISVLYSSLNCDHPNVLLKTAIAPLSFKEQPIDAKILFDEGATRTFITRHLADKLELKPTGSEAIMLSRFGDDNENNSIEQLNTATVKIQTIYGNEIPVDVLIVPKIAAPFKTNIETAKMLPYLQNLRLAHAVTEDTSFEIGLLVGADQYWNIVEDDIIRGEGPTAVKSKLGYLLSGPLKRTSSINETHLSTTNLGETEETHTNEDITERNTINIEHIPTFVDTSRTKQRTTGPLKVTETDKSALIWTRDTNKNKCFYNDLQRIGKSKYQLKQLNLYQELDYREKLTRKKIVK